MALVQSVDKCLRIIEEVSKEQAGLGVRELARRVGIGLTSVHNIASTLCERGYLWQDEQGKKYKLGVKLLRLAQTSRVHSSMVESAMPILQKLVSEIGETSVLAIMDHGLISKLLHITSTRQLRVEESGDDMEYAHATGYGKVLLASMDQSMLVDFLDSHTLNKFTGKTKVDRQVLLDELMSIKEQGFAIASDEAVEGVSAIAVPVKDSSGGTMAALGVSLPTVRFTDEFKSEVLASIYDAADQLSGLWS